MHLIGSTYMFQPESNVVSPAIQLVLRQRLWPTTASTQPPLSSIKPNIDCFARRQVVGMASRKNLSVSITRNSKLKIFIVRNYKQSCLVSENIFHALL